ncbi:MAG: hypothetical protein F6K45_20610 [Kamptonema sp. SIO1D9]|nr:hypothetical protein [Kamptonema sp. SIO1D9]
MTANIRWKGIQVTIERTDGGFFSVVFVPGGTWSSDAYANARDALEAAKDYINQL